MQSDKASAIWGQDLASELLAEGMKIEEGPLHIPPFTGADRPSRNESEEDGDNEDTVFFWVTRQRRILKIAWSVTNMATHIGVCVCTTHTRG